MSICITIHWAKKAHLNSTLTISLPQYMVPLQLSPCLLPFLIFKEMENTITFINKDKCPSRCNRSLGKLSTLRIDHEKRKIRLLGIIENKGNSYLLPISTLN